MPLFITLPCKPIVKQYLINNFGVSMHLPDGDLVKLTIFNLLQRNHSSQDTKITLQYYSENVQIPIDYKTYESFGDHLSKTSIRAINNQIEKVIHLQLFQFLEFYVHVANYQLKDAVYMFQQIYALPEDIYSFDTIKKHYQRKIQPFLQSQKFTSVNVLFKKPRKYKKAV